MEWSDAWSESNQQVHIQAGHEKPKWNGEMHGQSQINKFTYKLDMRKQMEWSDTWSESNQPVHILAGNEKANGMVRCMVRVKSTSSQVSGNEKANGMVRHMVRVKSTCSHTFWK